MMKTLYAEDALRILDQLDKAEVAMMGIPAPLLSEGFRFNNRADAVAYIHAVRDKLLWLTVADVAVEGLPKAAE